MTVSNEMRTKMKYLNFHKIREKDDRMCATCTYGHSLLGGTGAFCLETGFNIDWYFVCDKYRKEK